MKARYLLVGISLLLLPFRLPAATFCVTNGTELLGAMASAQINGQADEIRLAGGFYTYPATGGGTFAFFPTIAENYNIVISGGWSEFFGNPCGMQIPFNGPLSTVITTADVRRLMLIQPAAGSTFNITVRLLTFLGGDTDGVSVGNEGGGLMIGGPDSGHSGTVLVEQCAFLNNQAMQGAALSIRNEGTIRLRNSVFVENHARHFYAVKLWTESGTGIYATNNTVLDNTVGLSGDIIYGGLFARADDGGSSFVANNLLWGNEGVDLIMGPGSKFVRNNNIEEMFLNPPSDLSGNLSVAPVFSGESLDYTPVPGSPLIDAGIKPPFIVPIPPPFESSWSLGVADVFNRSRVQGVRVDIGAYEAKPTLLFKDGFE